MAIKFMDQVGSGMIGCWEISETTEELFHCLRPEAEELDRYLLFRNETRKKEWLAVRLLLRQMTGGNTGIIYTAAGKPELVNKEGNISISHSSGFVVIYFHPEFHPGIDIELITRNVERAARKFLSADELQDCTFGNQLSNKDLMLRWCAKEAVFKMVPYADIDFASQISCVALPFNSDKGALSATFKADKSNYAIPLQYRMIGELLMVWGTLKL